jgi:signal peptidase
VRRPRQSLDFHKLEIVNHSIFRKEQAMKWLKRTGSALLVCAAVLLGAALVLYNTGNLPYKVYIVHTGSMSPAIPSGSAVIVREGQYRVGDVVSFKVHGTIVTHRLKAVHPNGTITTKGDANETADPWHVPKSNIIGQVVASPRLLGYFLAYVRNPLGLASIAAILLFVWLIGRELFRKKPNGNSADQAVSQT